MCDHSRTIRYGYPRPRRMVGPTLDHIHATVGAGTCNPQLPSMRCIRALLSVCLAFLLSSCSWSWWEWRERRVGTCTDVTPPGGVWVRSTVCVLAIGIRGRIRTTNWYQYQISPAQIFVIAKFHVTNINYHFKYLVVAPLLYIVPSAKRFVRHYSGQPARKGNSTKLILS